MGQTAVVGYIECKIKELMGEVVCCPDNLSVQKLNLIQDEACKINDEVAARPKIISHFNAKPETQFQCIRQARTCL